MADPHRQAGRKAGHRKGTGRPREDTEGPERRCIVTGEVKPKSELLRFVADPDGNVVPDLDERLPGRGLWLSARRDMVETATARKAFSRAARRPLLAPPDLAQRVGLLLRERCLRTLGLANRAGLVVAGFEKVKAAAREGEVALLLEAAEGSEDGKRKVRALVGGATTTEMFTGAELASVLGREHVVHVIVLAGTPAERPLVARLKEEIERLTRYEAGARVDGPGLGAATAERPSEEAGSKDRGSGTDGSM